MEEHAGRKEKEEPRWDGRAGDLKEHTGFRWTAVTRDGEKCRRQGDGIGLHGIALGVTARTARTDQGTEITVADVSLKWNRAEHDSRMSNDRRTKKDGVGYIERTTGSGLGRQR